MSKIPLNTYLRFTDDLKKEIDVYEKDNKKLTKNQTVELIRYNAFENFTIDQSKSMEENFKAWGKGKNLSDGYFVKNGIAMTFPYPYGYRDTIHAMWIESDPNCGQKTKAGKLKTCEGQRFCTRTIDPKRMVWNKNSSCGTYSFATGLYADLNDRTTRGVAKINPKGIRLNSTEKEAEEFVEMFGNFFTDFEKKQVKEVKIWDRAMKHLKWKIVENPTKEESEEIDKRTKKAVRDALVYETAKYKN